MQRSAQLRQRIARHLQAFELHGADAGGLRTAAVAVAIADEGTGADMPGIRQPERWSTEAALLLTKRADALRNHAGQWALPGGRIDAGETPEQAALRELHEEVGLRLGEDSLLGRLDDFVTRSGYVITPVLVWAGAARELVPNPHEVRSIHRIPVAEFLRADAPMLDARHDNERPILRMPVGDSWIAAPTAAVLYQFRELCILGRPTRVAHFEQPLFAWK